MASPLLTDADRASLQRQIDAIEWYHEFDFDNGLRAATTTGDAAPHRATWNFIRAELDRIDFTGKAVLDIGCWDGYWSFYAERRGASHVLATDDVTQNWASGEGLRLAKHLLGSSIEIDQKLSAYELSRLNRTFDIVLCMGVYYHLVDPFAVFAQVRHCCHRDTVVVIEGDATLGLRPDTFYFNLIRPADPVFVPTPHGLAQMLRAAYLDTVRQAWQSEPKEPSLLRKIAYYSTALGAKDPTQVELPGKSSRLVTVCRPMDAENPLHLYKPPFGLHRYDPRFR